MKWPLPEYIECENFTYVCDESYTEIIQINRLWSINKNQVIAFLEKHNNCGTKGKTMKRFTIKTTATQERNIANNTVLDMYESIIVDDPKVEFVLFSDVEPELQRLRERDPFYHIELLKHEIKCLKSGCCPECSQKIAGYRSPTGSFSPEAWATMQENGIDPATGHKQSCKSKGKA